MSWEPIDAFQIPEHFSRFPAGIAHNAEKVVSTLQEVIEDCTELQTKEHQKALIRHSNPGNEPFAICHCTATLERLILLSSIIEVAWIHDGE